MNFRKVGPFILIVLFATSGCKKNITPNPAIPPPVIVTPVKSKSSDVYVVGYVHNYLGNSVATYWKNGVEKRLTDSLANSIATSIVISGKDVYIAGLTNIYNQSTVTYWKNGVPTYIASGNQYSTSQPEIAVNGSDVYILCNYAPSNFGSGGFYGTNVIATYWKNGVATLLNDGSECHGNAIAVNNTGVYIAGSVLNNGQYDEGEIIVGYWKDNKFRQLDEGFKAAYDISSVGMAVKDTDVYIVGSIYGDYGFGVLNESAVCWKNTHVFFSNSAGIITDIVGVALNGSDVYVSGNIEHLGMDWKNDFYSPLSRSINNYNVGQIAVDGSDVYVIVNGGYCKNGVFTQLPDCIDSIGIGIMPN